MGKETAGGLRLIDTDKFFASLAGRLDDEVFHRVAAAFAESCGRGGARHVIAHANLLPVRRILRAVGIDLFLVSTATRK